MRQTGTATYEKIEVIAGESAERYLALTVARTFEYYFDTGTIKCEVIDFFGTGLTPAGITSTDVAAWLTMHGYTVGSGAGTYNLTTAEVQLCLDSITAQVNVAATRWNRIAGYPLNQALLNDITLRGSVAQALYTLRNKGAASGLVQERVIIAETTAIKYQAEYERYIDDMTHGWNLGA